MKSDQVLAVMRAFLSGRQDEAVGFIRQMEASEVRAGNTTVARQLRRLLDSRPTMFRLPEAPSDLIAIETKRPLDSLILSDRNEQIIRQILREWTGRDRLIEHGLQPRNTLLLRGPSGNGKTALAEAIAYELKLPFTMANYSQVIDSYVGGTGKRLSTLFQFANKTACVVFFDEDDSVLSARIGGEKSGAEKAHNVSVNSLLIELDRCSPSSFFIFATNMADHLDTAFLRRISATLDLEPPCNGQVSRMIDRMNQRWPILQGTKWAAPATVAKCFAEIERLAMDAARREVLDATH